MTTAAMTHRSRIDETTPETARSSIYPCEYRAIELAAVSLLSKFQSRADELYRKLDRRESKSLPYWFRIPDHDVQVQRAFDISSYRSSGIYLGGKHWKFLLRACKISAEDIVTAARKFEEDPTTPIPALISQDRKDLENRLRGTFLSGTPESLLECFIYEASRILRYRYAPI